MTKWREIKLGDLGEVVTGKTPSTKVDAYWCGDIPFITPKDIQSSKHIFETERYLSNEGMLSVKGSILPKNAICVSCIGNIGYVSMTTKQSISNQQINSIIANDENDANFVYYLMKSLWPYFKNYEGQSTTLSILNKSQFSKIDVCIPKNKDIQKKIAGVLGALDDKIELNNKINNNLEQQAQALFKSWFVDKEYEVERETTLGVVCKCELGGTPSRIKSEYWGGNIAWINSGEVNNFRITKASEYITEIGLKHSATKLLPRKTTVLAITGATLGQISLLEIDSCTNQSVVGVLENETLPYEFIYPYICYNIKELLSHQTGGAQQHINKQNVEQLTLSLPKSTLIKDYKNIVAPIFELIAKNCFESERLASLRDALLPKLMSGEIDVSNVDISALTSTDKLSFTED